jgi:hypothetical protein
LCTSLDAYCLRGESTFVNTDLDEPQGTKKPAPTNGKQASDSGVSWCYTRSGEGPPITAPRIKGKNLRVLS